MTSWTGKRMKNPKGKIGKVVKDDNTVSGGRFRVLTVRFQDGTSEDLWLNNIGPNPSESNEWCWEHITDDGKSEWVIWN